LLLKIRGKLGEPKTYDSEVEAYQKKFQKDSRSWLFKDVKAWFDDSSTSSTEPVFWLQAGAGMGKTVFAAELVRRFNEDRKGTVIAVVFFKFNDSSSQDPALLLKSIVYQIVQAFPSIAIDFLNVLNHKSETSIEGIFDEYLMMALNLVASKMPTTKHLIVLDALDECGLQDSMDRKSLLMLFQNKFRELPGGVKLFVTGRLEKDIEAALHDTAHTIGEDDLRHLKDLEDYIHFSVKEFFERVTNNKLIAGVVPYDASTKATMIKQAADLICDKSERKFIYTAVVVHQMYDWFVKNKKDFNWANFQSMLETLPQGLDGCYQKTFDKLLETSSTVNMTNSFNQHAHAFLLLMVGCREALSEGSVKDLLGLQLDEDLTIIKNSTGTVFPLIQMNGMSKFIPYHKSIVDWLTDKRKNYFGREKANYFMVEKLLQFIGITSNFKEFTIAISRCNSLSANIYHIVNRLDLDIATIQMGPTLFYAIRHLPHHLNSCSQDSQLGLVTYYLMTNLTWLQWSLEAIGLAGVLESYSKLLQNNKWLPEPFRNELTKDIKLMLQFFKLLVPTTNPWRREICTQISARLAKIAVASKRSKWSRIGLLLEEATAFLKAYGGWSFTASNTLEAPGGMLEMTLVGHTTGVQCVCALGDGRVASGADDGSIKIWNTETGQCDLTLSGHKRWVSSLCVLGDRLVSGSMDNTASTVKIWNIESGKCELTFTEGRHTGGVKSLCPIGNDRVACVYCYEIIKIFNISTGSGQLVPWQGSCLCILRDIRFAMTASRNILKIWNMETDECVRELNDHTNWITSLCCLEDGRVISGCNDDTIKIWNTDTGECELNIICQSNLRTLCSLRDGSLVSGFWDNTIKIWNTNTGKCIQTISGGHTSLVSSFCVVGYGRFASGSMDKTIKIWHTETVNSTRNEHTITITACCVLANGSMMASGSCDCTIKIWNTENGHCERTLTGHTETVNCLCVLEDGRVVSGSYDETIKIWNTGTGECELTLTGHSGCINSLCLLGDGRIASGSDDKTIKLWNDTDSLTLIGHSSYISPLCYLEDGRLASGSGDKTIKIWNTGTGDCDLTLTGHSEMVTSLCYLGNDRLASGSADYTIKIWNTKSSCCKLTLTGHKIDIKYLSYLHEGILMSRDSNSSVLFWDFSTSGKGDNISIDLSAAADSQQLNRLLHFPPYCDGDIIEYLPLSSKSVGIAAGNKVFFATYLVPTS